MEHNRTRDINQHHAGAPTRGGKDESSRVFVAMSGGVDSSVAAALLKDEGFDVTGVFIKTWQPPGIECRWPADRRDALRVASQLDIPLLTYDFEEEYKREVVDYMIREYQQGRTPNPDVMCNTAIKFGAFLEKARRDGADAIATGHHVRKYVEGNTAHLLRGVDENKDQTYFLWGLSQDELAASLFPVGEYTKDDVRARAHEHGLATADKKDSQGLCFMGELDVKEFLKDYIDTTPGDVLDTHGGVIGTHPGSELFTLGERHGFTITQKTPETPVYYVVDKDVRANTLTVAPQSEEPDHYAHSAVLEDENWIQGEPDEDTEVSVQTRYRAPAALAHIRKEGGAHRVAFAEPQRAVAVGQSLVVYSGDECLGGGVIESTKSRLPR